MAKKKLSKNINLLEPSFSPKNTWDKIYDWVFMAGRYIIVAVELVVLVALGSRFYFDRKNNDLSESIKAKTVILDNMRETENEVKSAQDTLSNIAVMLRRQNTKSNIMENVEANTPSSIVVQGLSINDENLSITGLAYGYTYIEKLESNFDSDENWDDVQVTLVSTGSGRQIDFTMTANYIGNL
jgi:hypothetical protein